MKKIILFLFGFMIFIPQYMSANEDLTQYSAEISSYLQNGVIDTKINVPIIRKVNGGTIFQVYYEGEGWTNDMKGAVNYACKLWEEVLPPCFPIRIQLVLGSRMRPDQISKTQIFYDISEREGLMMLPSRRKAQTIEGFNSQRQGPQLLNQNTKFRSNIYEADTTIQEHRSLDYHWDFDFKITINKAMLSDLSFSISDPEANKYDFITIMLREIAYGLGFRHSFVYDPIQGVLDRKNPYFTPFEHLIVGGKSLDVNNFTTGTYTFTVPRYGSITLNAPNPWDNNESLLYWSIVESRPFTRLMSDQIGRETVIRDLSDSSLPSLIRYGLDWQYYILTSSEGSSTNTSTYGSNTDVIGFKNGVSDPIENPWGMSINMENDFSIEEQNINSQYSYKSNGGNSRNMKNDNTRDSSYYCNAWEDPTVISHLGYPTASRGMSFSVLKKDGTWDIVYYNSWPFISDIRFEEMEFHNKDNDYARTIDGNLRCRLTRLYNTSPSYTGTNQMDVHFYVMEALPQEPHLMLNGVVEEEHPQTLVKSYTSNPYERTVRISFNDVEGVTELMYKRQDIGNPHSLSGFADPLKGYVDVVVDIDFDTEITLIATNKNGSTQSKTLFIETLNLDDMYSIDLQGDELRIAKTYERDFGPRTIDYSLSAIDNSRQRGLGSEQVRQGQLDVEGDNISVSDLTPGLYVISLTDPRGRKQSYKFRKI